LGKLNWSGMDQPSQLDEEQQPRYQVSAIVVSRNNVDALRRCLAALERSKNRESMEVIVVDKGSRDECPNMDAEFQNVTMLRMPRNFGTTKALNIGMRTAVGDWMFFLVPEVEVEPDTVPKLLAKLESDAEAVAACPVIDADQFYRLPKPATGAAMEPVHVESNAGEIAVEGATFDVMLASKYFIRGINFLDEKYGETFSDADLSFQIRRSGKKIVAIPSVVCRYTPAQDRRSAGAERILEADRIAGAARYFGKYFGFMPSLMFRVKTVFKALFSFRFGLLVAVLGGKKIDGTQGDV